ncbi:hypothetical protein GIB67_034507 [Kingdonia uniflora]|uniref:Uncharacterized protein n=1 Tax=Kingdonia uniflora TaxID=39325 RepID=A0A7J7PB15_9MAGN|nr:hypothetical protein GIB67_034507 [Kingdonia uniflora]
MFYPRVNPDGTTFSMRASSNLIHTYPGRSGQSNKNANTQWVAKEVEEIIRTVRTTRPAGMKEIISRSLSKYSKDLQSNQWKSLLLMFKASFDGWLSGCRPVLSLDGYFLKGLVLVPRAQTHIDKMIKCYGQYQPTKQENHFLPPSLVRGAGRPRKQRIHDQDEEKSMARHMSSAGLPPAIPNMREKGSGGLGGGGGRSYRGARQTQDTKSPSPTQNQVSQAQRQSQATQAPRENQASQAQRQSQATQSPRQSQESQAQRQSQATQTQRKTRASAWYSHSHTGLKCAEGTHSDLIGLKCTEGMGKGLTGLKCAEGTHTVKLI